MRRQPATPGFDESEVACLFRKTFWSPSGTIIDDFWMSLAWQCFGEALGSKYSTGTNVLSHELVRGARKQRNRSACTRSVSGHYRFAELCQTVTVTFGTDPFVDRVPNDDCPTVALI